MSVIFLTPTEFKEIGKSIVAEAYRLGFSSHQFKEVLLSRYGVSAPCELFPDQFRDLLVYLKSL